MLSYTIHVAELLVICSKARVTAKWEADCTAARDFAPCRFDRNLRAAIIGAYAGHNVTLTSRVDLLTLPTNIEGMFAFTHHYHCSLVSRSVLACDISTLGSTAHI